MVVKEEIEEMTDQENIPLKKVKIENQNLLSQFWNLASLDEASRIDSTVNIIQELHSSGKKDDLDYTVQRLVKGLGSSRKAARQGYATALTHIMSEFENVTTDQILELMSENLTVAGSLKAQEERDNYFGQVFGVLAICKAKFKDGANENIGLLKKVLENLLVLSKKKSFLQEICAKGLCDLLRIVDCSIFKEHVLEVLLPVLQQGWNNCSPDDLMIVLTVETLFKKDLLRTLFKEHWNASEILCEDNFKDLAKVLMETTNTAHPRVHSLWNLILEWLFLSDVEGQFEVFWKTIVEDGLMQSTHERKFLAMNLLLKTSSKITADQVETVFSQTMLRCIINSCQSKENYLYNAVKDMLHKLPGKVTENKDKDVLFGVIRCLVGSHGNVLFDSITKTKVVEELALKQMDNLSCYFAWLQDVFMRGTTNTERKDEKIPDKELTASRAWVVSQLPLMLRCCKAQDQEDILIQIASFLFLHGYFVVLKKSKKETLLQTLPTYPVSESTQQLCRQRFATVLAELTNAHLSAEEQTKHHINGVTHDGEFFASKILNFAKKLLERPKHVQLQVTWTPEIFEAFNDAIDLITSMSDKEQKSDSVVNTKGVELLFVHATLQLFSNGEEAVDILNELQTCYKKAEEKKKRKKEEPHWTEVLTEILLGFLAQPSHLMRQVVDMVFPTITPHLTQDAFDLLINAIKPKKKNADDVLQMENELDDDEISEHLNDESQREKPGTRNVDEEESDEDREVSKENGDESDSSEDDDSDMEVDEGFKAELKAALGDSALNSKEEDMGSDKVEDIDMDTCDPKLLDAMDQALAAVFKSRKQKMAEKKNKKDLKQTILHFKLRVLDLIEIFIKRQPKDNKILQLLEPLLDVIKAAQAHSDEQVLFERTLSVFKNKLCHLHEYPSGTDLDVENVHKQIELLMEHAKTASSALFVTYITQGIIYLIRVLRGSPEIKKPSPLKTRSQRKRKETHLPTEETSHTGCLDEQRLINCYSTALNDFMRKRSSHLQPVVFVELIQRFPELGWKLAPEIPEYINEGCNNFRKVKACEMLKLLFSKKTKTFQDSFGDIVKPLNEHLVKSFEATKSETYSLKARQFRDIVNITDTYIKEAAKRHIIKKQVEIDKLKQALVAALGSSVVSRSAPLHSYCEKLVSSLESFDKPALQNKRREKEIKQEH